jgi:adenosylmethionine-8-amino-7-oxononanoate aminotransferase
MPQGAALPPKIARAEGVYYWDTGGKRYIDAASGPVAVNIGHSNERVLDAIDSQGRKASYAFPLSFHSDVNLQFNEQLLEYAGPNLNHAFITSGGSEAVEAALKFVRAYAVSVGQASRRNFISLNPSYHGATLGAVGVTGDDAMTSLFGAITNVSFKAPAPLSYRQPDGFDYESYARHSLTEIEDILNHEGPENFLAFIMEPIAGLSCGANVAPDFYYKHIRRICDQYGIFLIYDEVMTGGGRTGAFFAGDHWPETKPDIVTLSKGISAGYLPIGAMLAPTEMVESVVANGGFPHGQTYTTTPLACAAGVAVMQEIKDQNLVERAQHMGALMQRKLTEISLNSPIVGHVRGKGLLLAIEIVADKETKQMLPLSINPTARINQIAMENGLVLYPRRANAGKYGDWIMVTPPLIIDENQIDDLSSRLEKSLKAYADELSKQGNI